MRSFNIALVAAAVMLLAACTTTEPRTEETPAANAPRINGHFVEYDGWNAVCGEECACSSTDDFPEIEYRCNGRHPDDRNMSMFVEFYRLSVASFDLRYMAEAEMVDSVSVTSCPPGRSGDPRIAPEGVSVTLGRDSAGRWEDVLYARASSRIVGCNGGEDGVSVDLTAMVTMPGRDTAVGLYIGGMTDYRHEALLTEDISFFLWNLVANLEYYEDTVAAR